MAEETHPLNSLDLSTDRRHVECWHNGERCYTVHIGGQMHDAVARGQEWFRKHSGGPGSLSKALEAAMQASDSLFQSLAFGAEWR